MKNKKPEFEVLGHVEAVTVMEILFRVLHRGSARVITGT